MGTQPVRKRHRLKWSFTRRLYERGYAKQDILELVRLIDWLLVLSEELTVEFRRELREYEKEQRMPYVTSIERQGRQEGRQEDILDLLEARFGAAATSVAERVKAILDDSLLRRLLRQAALLPSLEAFLAELP